MDAVNHRVKALYNMYGSADNAVYIKCFSSDDDTIKFERQMVSVPEDDLSDMITGFAVPYMAAASLEPEVILSEESTGDVISGVETNNNGLTVSIVINIILALILAAVVYILIKSRKKPAKREIRRSGANAEQRRAIEQLEEELYNAEQNNKRLKAGLEKYKAENITLQKECKRLKNENDDINAELLRIRSERSRELGYRMKTTAQTDTGSAKRKAVHKEAETTFKTSVLDIYNETINNGEFNMFDMVMPVMENGRVKIREGKQAYMEQEPNETKLYPSDWILDPTVRESLSPFFDISVRGSDKLKLVRPCELKKDMYGYIVTRKGIVEIS